MDRLSVIRDIRDGDDLARGGDAGWASAGVVILETNDGSESSEVLVAVGIGGVVKAAATGHGSKALGVGTAEGKGYGITVIFPCKRTGLRVLPEGDHIKAIFAP